MAYFKQLDAKFKALQKENYDQHHFVWELPSLPEDETVWVDTKSQQAPGRILHAADAPRS